MTNSVTVSTPSYELVTANNTVTDVTATLDPNLSTSTKSVVDLNGGEASPGDTLRYTITLTESAGGQAVNVSLTDDVPDDVDVRRLRVRAGGRHQLVHAAPAGANGNGIVNVSAITVPASSSVTVVFDVTVMAGTLPGDQHQQHRHAQQSQRPGEQSRRARRRGESVADPERRHQVRLSASHRERACARCRASCPRAADTNEAVANGAPRYLDHHAGAADGVRHLRERDPRAPVAYAQQRHPGARNVTVTLTSSSGYTTTVSNSITPPNSTTTPTLFSFNLPNTLVRNFPAGTTFTLTVSQRGQQQHHDLAERQRLQRVNNSRIEFPATTVINVDSVADLQRRVQRRRGAGHVLSRAPTCSCARRSAIRSAASTSAARASPSSIRRTSRR